jgi:hypothetical protein
MFTFYKKKQQKKKQKGKSITWCCWAAAQQATSRVYVVCGAVRAPHWSVYIIPVTNGHNANIGNLIGLYHLTKAGPQPSMVATFMMTSISRKKVILII